MATPTIAPLGMTLPPTATSSVAALTSCSSSLWLPSPAAHRLPRAGSDGHGAAAHARLAALHQAA